MPASIEDVVSEIVHQRFPDALIDSVTVDADSDSDGDPILRITVVFASDMTSLEAHKLAGLARHVRPRLEERQNVAFPIFRFISKSDNDRLRHAAA